MAGWCQPCGWYYCCYSQAEEQADHVNIMGVVMPAVIILSAIVLFAALAVLGWRWLDLVEKVKVERERAGGSDRAKKLSELDTRVGIIEKYVRGA